MEPRIFLYGGSFNPIGAHHLAVIRHVLNYIGEEDQLVVIPCGLRPDKESTNDTEAVHRAAMLEMELSQIDDERLRWDLSDLERDEFIRTWDLDKLYQRPGRQVWHVIGTDLIEGGARNASEMQTSWYRGEELFQHGFFLVLNRPGVAFNSADLPPKREVLESPMEGSSSEIRRRAFMREDVSDLVGARTAAYIRRHHLYTGRPIFGPTVFEPTGCPLIIADESRPRGRELKALVERVYADCDGPIDHIIVIGGDGYMLDQLREHHHLRLPMIGLNAGTRGFLLNGGSLEHIEQRLRRRRYIVYRQPLLVASVLDEDTNLPLDETAANEFYLKADGEQSVSMRVSINGVVRFENLSGDGLMLSTAAGSTGWAFSYGGTPIIIGTPQIVITGIGTTSGKHRWGSVPLPMNAVVEITLQQQEKRPAVLVVDGRRRWRFSQIRMQGSRAHAVELGFFPETDLADKHMQLHFPD